MMNARGRKNPFRQKQKGRTRSSKLVKFLTIAASVYLGWLLLILYKLDHNHENLNVPSGMDLGGEKEQVQKKQVIDVSYYGDDKPAQQNPKKDNVHDEPSKSIPPPTLSRPRLQLTNFNFDRSKAEEAANAYPGGRRIKTLTAYLEKKLEGEIPGTRNRGDDHDRRDHGVPPKFEEPLQIRKTRPQDLKVFHYPKVDSCHDLTAKLPIDSGLLFNEKGERLIPNTNNQRYEFDVFEDAKFCPVDADPFLPWIHDMFPSSNGDTIHFVAQNKRRCNTGNRFRDSLVRLEPQMALFQAVGVQTLSNGDEAAMSLNPDLWMPDPDQSSEETNISVDGMPRYRLSSYEDADDEGKFTRFICRFHTFEYDADTKQTNDVIIGETLSFFTTNYEYVNLRKRKMSMLTSEGKDNGLFWLSNLRFDCPVPDNGNLREAIASGNSVLHDGTPSIYVDIVPIRTHARFGFESGYFSDDLVGPDWFSNPSGREAEYARDRKELGFEADKVFGRNHVLPRVEASGRWANLPVCLPPPVPPSAPVEPNVRVGVSAEQIEKDPEDVSKSDESKKPYTLTACVWASATFHTRGGDRKVDDTMERTREWIEYHLMVGFDHIYIYDNTHANANDTSLEETLSPFSASEVTRIDWPAIVCNNNIPAHENTGERSSQYAAESSCRQRYGQYTEWMAHFDTDEYFVPMGKYDNLKGIVNDAADKGFKALSFKSTRSYPNYAFLEKHYNGGECGKEDEPLCLAKRENATFLETYNCDFVPLPKPSWADRAKKQIYRPDYVLSHFVHYSTITKGILETYADRKAQNRGWDYWYREPKSRERFTDELEEAVMIHSKTTVPGNTKGYRKTCKLGFVETWKEKCRVGFAIPENKLIANVSIFEGYQPNCYTIDKVTNLLVPRLRKLMNKRTGRFSG